MIVVDASVLVTLLTDRGPRVDALQARLDSEDVVAPELVDVEVMSALRGLVIGGRLSTGQAEEALSALVRAPIERISHAGLVPRAWRRRENLTAYDAVYVALAELFGVPLLTRDARLAGAPDLGCAVEVLS